MIICRFNAFTKIIRYEKRIASFRKFSTVPRTDETCKEITILGQNYVTDEWMNITPKIHSLIGRNLHITKYHPLSHVRQRIVNYFYKTFFNRIGNPIFSIYDNINPVVTVVQNFDSLLVPPDHPSRNKTDCYYINRDTLLRAHTTAHQAELISMGLNNFLVIGDVYRRDEIDRNHYPVFHQVDACRIRTTTEVFENVKNSQDLSLFEHRGIETPDKQSCHSLEAVRIMEHELKTTLVGLANAIFGKEVQYRWVDQNFPFTHPSWELEVYYGNDWIEVLGCGIMRQEILERAGAGDNIGWAFGLGLERLAMCIYDIPDIRLFWSKDSGFLQQFITDDPNTSIQFKPVSVHPQCCNDMSFWLPDNGNYSRNDFYDIVRSIAGDLVEQIHLKDEFFHPKTKRLSHCYSIIYRHHERTLTQAEVNDVHAKIQQTAEDKLNVTVRK